MSNALIKIPTSIITALKVDEDGYLWFLLNRPSYFSACEKEFPASLQFYRKGKPFYLQVSGKVFIEEEAGRLNDIMGNIDYEVCIPGDKLLLLRMKMIEIKYHEQAVQRKIFADIRNIWQQWYLRIVKPISYYPPLSMPPRVTI